MQICVEFVAVHRHICVHGSANTTFFVNTTLVLFIVQSGNEA